jgi:hypothetical protein
MSSRILAGLLVGLSIGAIAACKDDEPTANGGGTTTPLGDGGASSSSGGAPRTVTPQNVTEFCDGTLGVVIGALEACCTAEDKQAQLYALTHDLAAALKPSCVLTLANSATAGRILTRPDRAQACYAAYKETYAPGKCENITRTFSDPAGTACREAFVGTVVEGGACLGDHECVDGLTCVGYTGSTDGHCLPPPAIGSACGAAPSEGGVTITTTSLEFGTHPACAMGAICDELTHKCVAGSPKTPGPEGSPCESADDCAAGLYCEAKKCALQKSAGAACTGGVFSSECAGRCDAPSSTAAGTCKTFCASR